MMSEYTMKRTDDGRAFELWQGDEKVRTFLIPIMPGSVVDTLNMETAPLLATIQAQQANLQIAADMLAEERAKVAHRDELLRIQGEACERYKVAIEDARQALSNQTHGGAQYQPDVLEADSILANALGEETEAAPTTEPAPKFVKGDKVRIKQVVALEDYPSGKYDVVHFVRADGQMILSFYDDDGISDCIYSAEDLEPYTEETEGEA